MQYGVGGARTNALANLLVFSFNSSQAPRATDFTVQLGSATQAGNVSVLSTYSSPSDYLVRVWLCLTEPLGFHYLLPLWRKQTCTSRTWLSCRRITSFI